jgi:hypothetical protein
MRGVGLLAAQGTSRAACTTRLGNFFVYIFYVFAEIYLGENNLQN